LVGGIVGSAVNSQKKFSYDLSQWSIEEKLSFIRKTFSYNDGSSVPIVNSPAFRKENVSSIAQQSPTNASQDVDKNSSEEVQNSTKVFFAGGVSIPMGEFGKVDYGNTSGLAKDGFVMRAALVFHRSRKFQLLVGVNYTVNNIDITPFQSISSSIETGDWKTLTPSIGMQRLFFLSGGKSAFYINGDLGIMFGFTPSITAGYGSNQINQSSTGGSGVAFSFGTGLVLNELVDIGVRYQYSKPKYEVSATNGSSYVTSKISQPTGIILVTLGIYLTSQ